jgi:hypothetical protein
VVDWVIVLCRERHPSDLELGVRPFFVDWKDGEVGNGVVVEILDGRR